MNDIRTQITDALNIDKFSEQLERFGQTAVSNYTETNDRVLDAVVDANRKMVDFAVKTATAVTDAVETPLADSKFADRIPTPAEAGKAYIDFVERAAEMNRDFNQRVIDMLPAEVKPAKKASVKPAADKATVKPAAKKATVKTAAAKTPAAKKASTRKAAGKK